VLAVKLVKKELVAAFKLLTSACIEPVNKFNAAISVCDD